MAPFSRVWKYFITIRIINPDININVSMANLILRLKWNLFKLGCFRPFLFTMIYKSWRIILVEDKNFTFLTAVFMQSICDINEEKMRQKQGLNTKLSRPNVMLFELHFAILLLFKLVQTKRSQKFCVLFSFSASCF